MANAVAAFLPEGTRDRECEPGPDLIEPGLRVRCYTAGPNGRLVPADGEELATPAATLGPDAAQRALEALRAEVGATGSPVPDEPTQANVEPLSPGALERISPFPD
jgi:hypothetical protein